MIFKSQVRTVQNKLLPDQLAIMYKYKKYMGKKLDLRNPTTFNEKIQWLKLNDQIRSYIDYQLTSMRSGT